VDTSVVAALITSGVAVAVAVVGGVRGELRASADRRRERRRAFLTDAQDAVLALRNALRDYGASLRAGTAGVTAAGGSFTMSVPPPLDSLVSLAEGRFVVTLSRLDDDASAAAMRRWRALARVSLIDSRETPAADEQHAFDEFNRLIGAALR
jgi:hypothetical protein